MRRGEENRTVRKERVLQETDGVRHQCSRVAFARHAHTTMKV